MTRIFPFPDSENGKDDTSFEDAVGGRVKTIYGAESVQTAPDESQRLPAVGSAILDQLKQEDAVVLRHGKINRQLNLNPEQQRWRRTRPESFTN